MDDLFTFPTAPTTPSTGGSLFTLPSTSTTTLPNIPSPAFNNAVNSLPNTIGQPQPTLFGPGYTSAIGNIGNAIGGAETSFLGGLSKGLGDLVNLVGGTTARVLSKAAPSIFGGNGNENFSSTSVQSPYNTANTEAQNISTQNGTSPSVQNFSKGLGEFAAGKLPLFAVGGEAAEATGIPKLLGGMLSDVPVVGQYLSPVVENTIKNLAGFSLADQPTASQENPISENPHWTQLVSDLGNSTLFGIAGSIPSALYAIPATGIAAYASAKLGGASNGQALASAVLIGGMHAYGVLGDEKVPTPEEAVQKAQEQARDTINKYSTDQIDENSTHADIDKAFKQAALKTHPDIPEGDLKTFQGVSWARDFLKSTPDKALADFKTQSQSETNSQPNTKELTTTEEKITPKSLNEIAENVKNSPEIPKETDKSNPFAIQTEPTTPSVTENPELRAIADSVRGNSAALSSNSEEGSSDKNNITGQGQSEMPPTSSNNPVFNERLNRIPLAERPFEEKRINDYKARLKLKGADPVLVDAIITPSGNRAYGVSAHGTLTFEKTVQDLTEDHEIFHQVFQNMDKMRLFKDFDKAGLMKEAKDLYGNLPPKELEEEMASDFQQYVHDRESGKETNFFGKIKDFFQRLFASLKRLFKTPGDIKDFYRTIHEGKATEETNIENTAPESFNTQQKQGVVDFRAADDAAEQFLSEVPAKDVFNDDGDLTLTTLKKLQQYTNPTAHFRMVREEIKQAAKDGKTALQFPTGETAMKIEGLGSQNNWREGSSTETPMIDNLESSDLKVGKLINNGVGDWIITDVLGDGKFKAVQKSQADEAGISPGMTATQMQAKLDADPMLRDAGETFDISGKIDTNNPIYRFYEKDLGRYLKSNYDARLVTDDKGVTWYEVNVNPAYADIPVPAFNEKNPEFNSGDKLADARAALAHVENRVGTKPTDLQRLTRQLERETLSLKAAEANPEMHKKAYGEDRKPKYKAKIADLKEKIEEEKKNLVESVKTIKVSGKEVELSPELQMRAIALEMKREDIDTNPYRSLLKYVQKNGDNAGRLPEVTGDKTSKSKFTRSGDDIAQELIPHGETYSTASDTEHIREQMDNYIDQRKEYLQEQKQFVADRNAYVAQAKDEIALNKLAAENSSKIAREIAKVEKENLKKTKAAEVLEKSKKSDLEAKEKKYGFTVPNYAENSALPNIPEIISQEDALKTHPAKPFMKYVNYRTGLLPEISTEHPGVYGKEMTDLLKKQGFSSVAEAQKSIDNFIANVNVLDKMTEDRFNPLEIIDNDPAFTNAFEAEKLRLSKDPNAQPLSTIVQGDLGEKYPLAKKVGAIDYLGTPKFVFAKMGLEDEMIHLKEQYRGYLKELPKNIEKIEEWINRLPTQIDGAPVTQRIFDLLNGDAVDENGFIDSKDYTQGEIKVANEIRTWLNEWADRLHIPEYRRLSNYITHIFEDQLAKKEFDEDLAKIIRDKIPGEVYDPFLQERLGKLGYRRDAWAALQAYVKRATRKVYMDPALEQIKIASKSIDSQSEEYVMKYISQVNKRPTGTENLIDTTFKQWFGYRAGARPTARLSNAMRRMVGRAVVGLNPVTAVQILMQGSNTYAKLGERHTVAGYMKLFDLSAQKELVDEGIMGTNVTEQDRTLSATKKFWQKTDKVLYFMMDKAIKINKTAAYFGAKSKYYAENSTFKDGSRIFNDGSSEKEAINYARNLVEDTQFDFGAVDIPVMLGSDLAKTAFQFSSFNTKQAEFFSHMIREKNWKGMLRYVVATLALMLTIGQALGIKWSKLIPFSTFNPVPPAINAAIQLGKAAIGAPDEFGQIPSGATRIKNAIYSAESFIPAGIQGSNTIAGAKSIAQGETSGIGEDIKALIFGPKTIANNVISKKLNTAIATAQTKVNNFDPSIVAQVQPIYDQAKAAGFGTAKANALVAKLSDNQYTIYKAMKAVDTAKDALSLEPKVLPIVQQADTLGFGTDAANALIAKSFPNTPEGDREYAAYTSIKKSLYGANTAGADQNTGDTGASGDTGSNSLEGTWQSQNLITHIVNIARAVSTDPVTAFNDIFAGNSSWQITGFKNGQIIVNRMSEQESQNYKAQLGGKTSEYKLDHAVPLEIGGNNGKDNLTLLTTAQWAANTPVEDFLGKALDNDQVTGDQAREYIIRYKMGVGEPLSQTLQNEYKNKYNSQPLTFDQIKSLVK